MLFRSPTRSDPTAPLPYSFHTRLCFSTPADDGSITPYSGGRDLVAGDHHRDGFFSPEGCQRGAGIEPFSPGTMAKGPGSARWYGKDGWARVLNRPASSRGPPALSRRSWPVREPSWREGLIRPISVQPGRFGAAARYSAAGVGGGRSGIDIAAIKQNPCPMIHSRFGVAVVGRCGSDWIPSVAPRYDRGYGRGSGSG